jgi:hypothetical protein
MRFPVATWILFVALPALAGCGFAPIYGESQTSYLSNALTPRRQWSASGTVSSPPSAIDGSLDTAAIAPSQSPGQQLTLDLGKSCIFSMVAIDHGRELDGFARSVEVSVSPDGTDFQPVFTGVGTRRVTVLVLPKATLGRFVRIRALTAGNRPWTLAEVYLQ